MDCKDDHLRNFLHVKFNYLFYLQIFFNHFIILKFAIIKFAIISINFLPLLKNTFGELNQEKFIKIQNYRNQMFYLKIYYLHQEKTLKQDFYSYFNFYIFF